MESFLLVKTLIEILKKEVYIYVFTIFFEKENWYFNSKKCIRGIIKIILTQKTIDYNDREWRDKMDSSNIKAGNMIVRYKF